jgi:hypothetical protein
MPVSRENTKQFYINSKKIQNIEKKVLPSKALYSAYPGKRTR